MIVGTVLSFLAAHDLQVDDSTELLLVQGLTGVFAFAYYIVASLLQTRWPLAGLLLGSTARPIYEGKHRKASLPPATATSGTPEDRL
ncbi:hypothetical protein [Streptomyces sp. NPDC059761]|uniref:hypothetical protein n=1 Tax=Streptomyces sp. NPDC059761 TaxID=3346937 RepID=UPI003655EDDB